MDLLERVGQYMITWATELWSVVESDHTYYCHSQHTNTILMYFDMLQWLALIIETGNILLTLYKQCSLSLSLSLCLSLSLSLSHSLSNSASTQPPSSSESGAPPTSPGQDWASHNLTLSIQCFHHLYSTTVSPLLLQYCNATVLVRALIIICAQFCKVMYFTDSRNVDYWVV